MLSKWLQTVPYTTYHIQGGLGKPHLPLDVFASDIPYIHMSYCFTVLCHCINIEHSFKGEKHAEKKDIGEHQACFPPNFT